MALSAEEQRRKAELAAELGLAAPPNPNRKAELEAEIPGLADAAADVRSYKNRGSDTEATTGDKIKHVAKGFGQLGFDLLETPYHVEQIADAGIKLFGGEGLPGGASTKPWTQALMGDDAYNAVRETLAGEEVTREQSPWAERLRTGVEWGGAGPISALKKGGKEALPDLAMGLGAMAGEEADVALGGEGTAGEIIGGVTGMLAGRPPKPKIGKNPNATETARKFVMDNAEDPEGALSRLMDALARGEEGTLADLTGDRGIYDVEAATAQSPQMARSIEDVSLRRQAQIAEDLRRPFGEEDAGAAAEGAANYVERRMGNIETAAANRQDRVTANAAQEAQRLEKSAAAARAEARAASDRAAETGSVVDTTLAPEDTSRALASRLDNTEAAFRANVEQPAWEDFKAQDAIPAKPIWQSANRHIKQLDPSIRARLGDAYGRLIGRANEWKKAGEATPAEVSRYFSDISDAVDEARDANGRLSKDGKLLNDLLKDMQSSLEDANDLYGAARSATRELNERWRRGPLDKARRAEPEQFADRMGLSKTRGATAMRQFAENGDPELIPLVAQHLKALAADGKGVDDAFIAKHRSVINRLPDQVKQQFTEAAAARSGAADSAKMADAMDAETGREALSVERQAAADRKAARDKAKGLSRTVEQKIVADYAKSPQRTLDRLLANADNTKDFGRLYRYMERTGNADSFKAHVRDKLQRQLATASDSSTQVQATSVRKFEDMRDVLVDAGVITRQEATEMSTAMNRTRSLSERKRAVANRIDKHDSEFDNLLASALAAGGLASIPGFGSSLIVGGAVRRYMKKLMRTRRVTAAEIEALENLMLNPAQYAEAATGAKTAEEAARAILSKAVGTSQVLEGIAPDDE